MSSDVYWPDTTFVLSTPKCKSIYGMYATVQWSFDYLRARVFWECKGKGLLGI